MSDPLPIRNPFEHRVRHAAFEAAVRCYIVRHRDLFRPNGRRADGSAPSVWFWRGYDGIASSRWQDDARQMTAYAFYRAGQAVAAAVAKGLIPEQPCAPSPNIPASAAVAHEATG